MGESRQQLFEKLDDLPSDHSDVPKVQKRINEIEEWMIKQGYIKHVTKWGEFADRSPIYPLQTGYIDFDDVRKYLNTS